jgi:hypothetical protein
MEDDLGGQAFEDDRDHVALIAGLHRDHGIAGVINPGCQKSSAPDKVELSDWSDDDDDVNAYGAWFCSKCRLCTTLSRFAQGLTAYETPSAGVQPPIRAVNPHCRLGPCLLLILGDVRLNLICQLEVTTLDRIPTNPLEDYAAARTW